MLTENVILPKVAIITLNWNGRKDTDECLQSLLQINYPDFEIIVVDNGSKDGSFPYLEKKYPTVTFIKNRTNRGFAEGNNIGVRYATRKGIKRFFIINNDTVVDKNVLRELVNILESNDNIAIVGPKVYNYYHKNTIESAGGDFSIAKSKNYQIGYGENDYGQHNKDCKVGFMSGCAMLVKDSIVDKGQLFERSYFAYFEDTELCYNVRQMGHEIWYVHKAKVWHKVSASTGGYKSPISTYLFTKNRIQFALRVNDWRKFIFMLYFCFYYLPAFTVYQLLLRKTGLIKAFYRAILSTFFPFLKYTRFEFKPEDSLYIGVNARYLQRDITGIERYILEVLQNLATVDKENTYTLFFGSHGHLPKLPDAANHHKYITHMNTRSRLMRVLWEQFILGTEVARKKIDVFHGTSFVLPFIKSCKYVITIYDLAFMASPDSFTLANRLYFKLFLAPSIKLADKIIAISQATKKDIIKYFHVPADKVEVIHCALSPKIHKETNNEKLQEVKKKYSLPDKFIMFTGLISPRKNLDRSIKAFAKVRHQIPHKFVIVGKKGWLYEPVFKLVEKLGIQKDVIFTGYIPDDDLCALYTLADIFMFPSLYEGFGLPILEAMACGCPVITSNISSMPEVAGDAALLVNPYSVNDIAKAIERIYCDKNLRKQFVNKGYAQIKKFTWKNTAKRTLKVYESLA